MGVRAKNRLLNEKKVVFLHSFSEKMQSMTFRDIKPWEWALAVLLALAGTTSAVLVSAAGGDLPTMTDGAKVFWLAASLLESVVLLWALWDMYRMARWQERKPGLMLAFWIVTFADMVCQLAQSAMMCFAGPMASGMVLLPTAATIAHSLVLLVALVVTVRLFHDAVRPLCTVLVAYVVLPLAAAILLPVVRVSPAVAQAVGALLTTLAVALLFLFRMSPGADDEEDWE